MTYATEIDRAESLVKTLRKCATGYREMNMREHADRRLDEADWWVERIAMYRDIINRREA